jgi:hypothetical protein
MQQEGRSRRAPTISGDLSVGALRPSAQINLEILAIIFEIGITF